MTTPRLENLLTDVAARAIASDAFGPCAVRDNVLVCQAKASAAPASYRLFQDGGKLYVSLVTADRWLSQSIEGDLVHTGDRVEDLVRDELIELGELSENRQAKSPIRCEHFRSDDLLFTFRSPLPVTVTDANAPIVALHYLQAYELAFRYLGDMNAEADGD